MSLLAEKFTEIAMHNSVKIKGKWYIAKWNPYYSLKGKLKDCIKILRGKAIAIHFKEDEGG